MCSIAETGKPLFPVEERPVPSGGVEPDDLSPDAALLRLCARSTNRR